VSKEAREWKLDRSYEGRTQKMPVTRLASDAIVSPDNNDISRGGVTMPVDDRLFGSEIKRLDSDISNIKKEHEKFETRVENAIYGLREEMKDMRQEFNAKIDKLDARIDKLDARLWLILSAIIVSIVMPIVLKFM
jgi:peptidoglycan hydrolase CwlO-like protein